MRRLVTLILVFVLIFMLTACTNNSGTTEGVGDSVESNDLNDTSVEETKPVTYTYSVSAMQGVDHCVYYGPTANVPNSPDPEAARNRVHIWSRCLTCGDHGDTYHFKVKVDELDFSNGDTIQYTGTDTCRDCHWDKGGDSTFMWAVSITRKVVEE